MLSLKMSAFRRQLSALALLETLCLPAIHDALKRTNPRGFKR
ncbi:MULTISPECIES: hypothetical protein [unclassified Moorena]|nr:MULTISPECIES: hypothetical protein [unclassified Moorena]